ncbi:hypothetical protein pEaSNUABM29_00035 [Erwinia phage pEa_SNUABM_29]|nr:hypothetical protein pEaSNUABM29_00035 [Erwinia phage pEa_SNUABM_29]
MDILKVVNGESDAYWMVRLLDMSKPNANGVVYAPEATARSLTKGLLRQPRVFCEFGQPDLSYLNVLNPVDSDRFICRQSAVRQDNICGALSNIRVDQRQVTAELRPWGKHASVLRDLLKEEKAEPVFALRALTNAKGEVDKIISWDLIG